MNMNDMNKDCITHCGIYKINIEIKKNNIRPKTTQQELLRTNQLILKFKFGRIWKKKMLKI